MKVLEKLKLRIKNKHKQISQENENVDKFIKEWDKKGYELIDITPHIKFELGNSGWVNDFNEPEQNIYHVKMKYRNLDIGNFSPELKQVNVDSHIELFVYKDIISNDFIVFRKVKKQME